jgi:hypothetical protein
MLLVKNKSSVIRTILSMIEIIYDKEISINTTLMQKNSKIAQKKETQQNKLNIKKQSPASHRDPHKFRDPMRIFRVPKRRTTRCGLKQNLPVKKGKKGGFEGPRVWVQGYGFKGRVV